MLKKWDDLPPFMKCDEVRVYYNSLRRKRLQLLAKRGLDYAMAALLLVLFLIPMLLITVLVAMDSKGPVIFRQTRITSLGKHFVIHKFRTMYTNIQDPHSLTARRDEGITRIGSFLRRTRLDELPQLYDILVGHMSFVGTRPEVPEFVACYSKEMFATMLLPAGITSTASIRFRDEAKYYNGMKENERKIIYTEQILPKKMKDNLNDILHFSILNDLKIIIRTGCCLFE